MISNKKIVLSALFAVSIFVLCAKVSRADSFRAVIAYGDSLSDNGNFHSYLGLLKISKTERRGFDDCLPAT